jgi:hypothetical protein
MKNKSEPLSQDELNQLFREWYEEPHEYNLNHVMKVNAWSRLGKILDPVLQQKWPNLIDGLENFDKLTKKDGVPRKDRIDLLYRTMTQLHEFCEAVYKTIELDQIKVKAEQEKEHEAFGKLIEEVQELGYSDVFSDWIEEFNEKCKNKENRNSAFFTV